MNVDRSKLLALAACTAGLALAACGGAGPPVGTLSVEPGTVHLPYPGFADLTLTWEPAAELSGLEGRPTVFVHLLDESGDLVRTFDQPLPAPWAPGSPQTQVIRLYQSALAEALPTGRYRLTSGLYSPADGRRWPLTAEGEAVGDHEYHAGWVEVPAAPAPEPRFSFDGEWLPLESGTDRQILARRWLSGPAVIRLESDAAGTAWLRLRIPVPDAPGVRPVYEGGDGTAWARVSSPCSGTEVRIEGAGDHEIEIPLAPAAEAAGGPGAGVEPDQEASMGADADGDPQADESAAPPPGEAGCTISVEPGFYLILEDTFERRALTLEILSWRAEG